MYKNKDNYINKIANVYILTYLMFKINHINISQYKYIYKYVNKDISSSYHLHNSVNYSR